MLRIPGRTDPLLGRAFALYDVGDDWIDLVFLVVGKVTTLMAKLKVGDAVSLWGPLGNGFPLYEGVERLLLVAGGIGQTPFPALIKRVLGTQGYGGDAPQREVETVTLYYGARSAEYFAGLDDFRSAGAQLRLAANDGSQGYHGHVTELLDLDLDGQTCNGRVQLVGCGPEPMLHALAKLARRRGLPCDLSLETPMACGTGICFSCVTRVRIADGWDYRRVCVDGPIFSAADLLLS